jgi:hypothetical protein
MPVFWLLTATALLSSQETVTLLPSWSVAFLTRDGLVVVCGM